MIKYSLINKCFLGIHTRYQVVPSTRWYFKRQNISVVNKQTKFLSIWNIYYNWVRQTGNSVVKNLTDCQSRRCRFSPWIGKVPWRRKCQPTPVFLPGKSHGQRSLEDYSQWGRKESDMTEPLTCLRRWLLLDNTQISSLIKDHLQKMN